MRSAGGWGIEIIGGELPAISQSQPTRLKIFRTEADVRQLAAAYKTLQKSSAGVDAGAEVNYDRVVFRFMDHWRVKGAVLSLRRRVEVIGNSPGGFDSAMTFQLPSSVGWSDINYMAPGALYGDPTYNGDRCPGGTLNYAAHHFYMREDILPVPLFALSFRNGTSVAILDPSPRGDSTVEEPKLTQPVQLAKGSFAFPNWSHDGEYIYFEDFGKGEIRRVAVSSHKFESVAGIRELRRPGDYAGIWSAPAYDGSPMVMRDTGIQEIYALDLQLP